MKREGVRTLRDRVDYLMQQCEVYCKVFAAARVFEVYGTDLVVTAVRLSDPCRLIWCVHNPEENTFLSRFGGVFLPRPEGDDFNVDRFWPKVEFHSPFHALDALEGLGMIGQDCHEEH